MRRFLTVFAVAGLGAGLFAPSALASSPSLGTPSNPSGQGISVASSYSSAKTDSGRLAQSDPALLSRTDSKIISVMVKLDIDPVASYRGGINNLKATSPSVTGTALSANGAAASAYTSYLMGKTESAQRAVKAAVPSISIGQIYLVAYGGFEARLPANQAKQLLKVPGVAAVQMDTVEQPLVGYSPHYIGADQVWPSLGGSKFAGEGTILADIDTGVWPENPMLADKGLPAQAGGPYTCDFGTSGQAGDAAFTCNHKLLGAYAFLQTNLSSTGPGLPGEFCPDAAHCSARDADGHGTHTTTTAAGDLVNSAVMLGVDRGPVSGVAPGASVIEYRVCDTDGCFESDSVAAVQQAIMDGVDAINFSISGGANPYSDPVELAFLDAYAAGISPNAAAGNSGPGAATSDHGGPWTTTVGASTWNGSLGASTLHLTATGGATLDVPGVTITAGIASPTPVVLASAAPYSDALCQTPASSGTFTGDIVVCERGTNARVDKGYNVLQGGAAGFILYNVAVSDLETDSHFLPAIHVNDPSSTIAAFVTGHTGVMATWAAGVLQPALGDEMASFSSRGPLGDFIKPDITAPGVQIFAGNSFQHLFDPVGGLGPNGENYQAIAGTSMATPHSAGTALLIKAAHPSWTPGQIKSAEMTSAVHDVVKEDGTTPADPFDDGAGAIRVNRAVMPTVTFDVPATDYYQASNDELNWINLNLASIDAADMQGLVTTTRTAKNVSGHTQTLILSASGPSGSITVTPSKLVIPANQSATFTVRIDASGLSDGQYFGSVTLNPKAAGALNAVLPVAFNKQESSNVTFNNTCDSNSLTVGTTTSCEASATNFTPNPAQVTLRVHSQNGNLQVKNYSPATKWDGNGFTATATLGASLPPPVTGLDGPAGDTFFELQGFAADQAGFFASGDEGLLNFSLSHAVRFGDRTYSTIGVVTDGYLVVGGGTSADIAFDPQDMPDPARPNNVIAPYWTDLNFEDGGHLYVGLFDCITAGDSCAYEFEFKDVPIYGTGGLDTRSFAVWMYTDSFLSSVSDPFDNNEIVYDSGSAVAGDALTPMNVGAEDALGLTGAEIAGGPDNTGTVAPDANGYYVETGSSEPGGTLNIDYDVLGQHVGNGHLRALMDSNQTVGSAKIVTNFTVHH